MPALAGVASCLMELKIENPENAIAVFGLLAGVLLGAFTQLASWRSQLSARVHRHEATEGTARRAVDEAVAHTLLAVAVSVVCALLAVGAGIAYSAQGWGAVVSLVLTAAVAAATCYLALTLLIIVNLLWDGYVRSRKIDEGASKREQQHQ